MMALIAVANKLIKMLSSLFFGNIGFLMLLVAANVNKILCEKYVPEFNDKQAFEISWLGAERQNSNFGNLQHLESLVMSTKENEAYRCFLPNMKSSDNDDSEANLGLHPEELLAGVLTLKGSKCSYRLEPYWTYEVCHGLHVRQFHEEKGPGQDKVKVQEYYLGRVIAEDPIDKTLEDSEVKQEKRSKILKVPKRDIDGRQTPYYNFTMDNGTPCDISKNKPRRVDVLYICHPTSSNEVVSVKEITTCEYEVIILTPELCHNPAYVVKENPVNDIKCLPLKGAPSRPSRLIDLEASSLEEKTSAETRHTTAWITKSASGEKANDGEPTDGKETAEGTEVKSPVELRVTTSDDQLTKDFLNGEYCLQGGSGWWLYEFCYGKHVQQFHQDASGKTVIYLGYWDKKKHLEWAKKKKNFVSKTYVSHYYSNGDVCDLTGKPRNAQVKLKCPKDRFGQQISIYMLEPKPCEYIVGIESPILCPFIESADAQGIFKEDGFVE